MNRTVIVYFLLLVVPSITVPFALHRILERELSHGREMGRAYLQAQAQLASRQPSGPDPRVAIGTAPPADGRCHAMSTTARGERVFAWWKGDVPPGLQRRTRIHGVELTISAASLVLFAAGAALLVRTLNRTRNETRRQRAFVADFTHRLKTPLTSISLCAELVRAERLSPARKTEATETIVAEAEKLNGIVDEVLGFLQEPRHG